MQGLRVRPIDRKQATTDSCPVPVPQFTSQQERLDWIQQQADQITVQALVECYRRLSIANRCAKKG